MAILSYALYLIFYAIGIGALPCTIATKLFPDETKPLVLSFASGLDWINNILVGNSFPLVQCSIGEFSLIFFLLHAYALIFYFFIPETCSTKTAEVNINTADERY